MIDQDGSDMMYFVTDRCQTVLTNNNDSYVPKNGCPLIRVSMLNRMITVTRPCPLAAAAGYVVIVVVGRATIPRRQ